MARLQVRKWLLDIFLMENQLVLLPIGKLTNIALALLKEPLIIPNIRIVWLGSNYPKPGEYNLENDVSSMNFLLNTKIEFEIVTVRYGESSGTDFVKVTEEDVINNMPKLGDKIDNPVEGRHGGSFFSFGQYSKNLFDNTSFYGNPPSRSLFDMAAVAIVKNPLWARSNKIQRPIMIEGQWIEQKNNSLKIKIWENFDKDKILKDFYRSLKIED